MKKISLFLTLTLICFQGMTQDYRLKLWPAGAPNQNTPPGEERFYVERETGRYDNISEAELFVYLPESGKSTGAAVVICPGGGYWVEAIEHEGFMIAEYLKENGIAGIVLKYRLPYGQHEVPLSDALQAIRYVRSKSADWEIDPAKVGIAGSSAGGHLASTAGTHFDLGKPGATDPLAKISSRPDFMLLLYPVISFDEKIGHMGSRKNLIGETNDWKLASLYSNELQVTENTPPTFFILADDDKTVVPENSIRFYMALKKYGIPAELHIFNKGGHGFGMRKIDKPAEQWPVLFLSWMKEMDFI
ncbi:alpha/beta hydrolase [Gaoshiqia sp. Z1-71]|uniref:alpha/beta hydrolase n=1 Tax=Gaoshiqia hydrogeniformans TaxID=3290090 RepID=UPI003BF78873